MASSKGRLLKKLKEKAEALTVACILMCIRMASVHPSFVCIIKKQARLNGRATSMRVIGGMEAIIAAKVATIVGIDNVKLSRSSSIASALG